MKRGEKSEDEMSGLIVRAADGYAKKIGADTISPHTLVRDEISRAPSGNIRQ